jgi:hypothetical protein
MAGGRTGAAQGVLGAGRDVLHALAGQSPPPKYIRAYHGSPHSFDRFDASKIGTGEGAQAYGHGLYFAGKEDVARSYRDIAPAVPSAEALESLRRIEERLQKLQTEKYKLEYALEEAAAQGGLAAPGWGDIKSPPPEVLGRFQPKLKAVNDELSALAMEQMQVRQGGRGHMYEVELGVPGKSLLDWDAPISRQPPKIRKEYGTLAMDRPGDGGRIYRDIATRHGEAFDDDLTGVLANLEASRELMSEGIPGVRYLDGNSRAAGQGSHNYVMFPGTEDQIRILRKYGLMAPIAAGAMQDQ